MGAAGRGPARRPGAGQAGHPRRRVGGHDLLGERAGAGRGPRRHHRPGRRRPRCAVGLGRGRLPRSARRDLRGRRARQSPRLPRPPGPGARAVRRRRRTPAAGTRAARRADRRPGGGLAGRGVDRRRRRLRPLHRARDRRRHRGPLARVDARPPARRRRAPAVQPGQRHQLRHVRAGAAATRLRLRRRARPSHRRPPRRRGRADEDPGRHRAHADRGRPAHLRRRRPGGAGRRHGRARERGHGRDHAGPARGGQLCADRRPSHRAAAGPALGVVPSLRAPGRPGAGRPRVAARGRAPGPAGRRPRRARRRQRLPAAGPGAAGHPARQPLERAHRRVDEPRHRRRRARPPGAGLPGDRRRHPVGDLSELAAGPVARGQPDRGCDPASRLRQGAGDAAAERGHAVRPGRCAADRGPSRTGRGRAVRGDHLRLHLAGAGRGAPPRRSRTGGPARWCWSTR